MEDSFAPRYLIEIKSTGIAFPIPVKKTNPVVTKPVETKPVETIPVETKPVETKPVETKPPKVHIDDGELLFPSWFDNDSPDMKPLNDDKLKIKPPRTPSPVYWNNKQATSSTLKT